MEKKNKSCCPKDMGPHLKQVKTGVFTRTRSASNSPAAVRTSNAGPSSNPSISPSNVATDGPSTATILLLEYIPHTEDIADAAEENRTNVGGTGEDIAAAGEGSSKSVDAVNKRKPGGIRKNAKEKSPNTNPTSTFSPHCSPSKLIKLLSILNEKQKNDIRSIGFGGLLSLQLTKLADHGILFWLITHFNPHSRVQKIDDHRFFTVTADDIFDLLMLPRNEGFPVLKYTRKEDGAEIVKYLRETYNIRTTKAILDTIRSLVDGGDDFKRLFVLYSLSSFLTPSSNQVVATSIIKSLVDVNGISKLDWCSYVLDSLCESVDLFKPTQSKNVSGCVIILQILYFHRLKWRGVSEPSTIPLIKHWTDKRLADRCSAEKCAKVYGSGELCADAFPLTVNGKLKGAVKFERSKDGESGKNNDVEQEFREIALSMGKEAAEFSKKYTSKLDKLMKNAQASKKSGGESVTSTPESDQFFLDEKLYKYMDDLRDNFLVTQKLTDAILNCELLSPDPPVRDEAYFGINEDFEVIISGGEELEEVRGGVREDDLVDAMHSITPKRKQSGTDVPCKFWNISVQIGYASKYMAKYKKLISKMAQPDKEILDYCFFESEKNSPERYYRQGYYSYIESDDILTMLPKRQISAQVVNAWCNVINHISFSSEMRSRCILSLNHNEALIEYLSDEDVHKLFNDCKKNWDCWLDSTMDRLCIVDMIFIPYVIESQYVAAAVDFVNAKVHYLSNKRHSDIVERNTFYDAGAALLKCLSRYLVSKMHPRAEDILTFEVANVLFPWQTSRPDADSGVYLMHHMKNFNGVVYTAPDMNKADVRNVLRAQMTANIILSNENNNRIQVIDKAYTFYKDKPTLLKLLLEKKKKKHEELNEQRKKKAEEELRNMSEVKRGKRRMV